LKHGEICHYEEKSPGRIWRIPPRWGGEGGGEGVDVSRTKSSFRKHLEESHENLLNFFLLKARERERERERGMATL